MTAITEAGVIAKVISWPDISSPLRTLSCSVQFIEKNMSTGDATSIVEDQTQQRLFSYIDTRHEIYVDRLREAVSIKSVSQWPEYRSECVKQAHVIGEELKRLGAEVELAYAGTQTLQDESVIDLPPVVLAQIGTDPNKKMVLIYGHLDVQPAQESDGWGSDPWVLTEKDEALYARGATDDKGPILATLAAVEAYRDNNVELPVNIKFVYECMEESNSEGLEELLIAKKNTFLKDVDYVCISDSYWLGKTKPCLVYGLRGITEFMLEVECASQDLHSGVYGGSIYEAMTDCIHLLSKLVDHRGKILVPGVYDSVRKLTPSERALYKPIEFDMEEFKEDIGVEELIYENKVDNLMHRWRFPSLSIHGIEGAFSESGCKTVIPAKVIGKFSIRLVPDQTPEVIRELVINYVNNLHAQSGSPNQMSVTSETDGEPWMSDFNDKHYDAGRAAILNVFGCEPDYTREGASIPITIVLRKMTKRNVMLLPMGRSDDGAHSQNEKFDRSNYFNGIKLMISYFHELSKLSK